MQETSYRARNKRKPVTWALIRYTGKASESDLASKLDLAVDRFRAFAEFEGIGFTEGDFQVLSNESMVSLENDNLSEKVIDCLIDDDDNEF